MLVLSRRLNEKIILPDLGVALQVTAIDRGRVRIGIEAPPDIRIMREELGHELEESWHPLLSAPLDCRC